MIEFRTVLKAKKSDFNINFRHPILSAGSCFAEHIGNKLDALKIPILVNPFGIIYHPIPLANMLNRLTNPYPFTEKDIFKNGDLWHSWMHHGSFSHPDPFVMLEGLNQGQDHAAHFLKRTNFLLLTLGTANGFLLEKGNQVVANCHKMPGNLFQKKRTETESIQSILEETFNRVLSINPNLKIILTVSPVRHLRDGLVSNNRSKATLLLASEWLEKRFDQVEYFPAYELVMDDLRDYRFYAPDKMHPSQEAVDYVWNNFMETYMDNESKEFISELQKIQLSQSHRALFPQTPSHQKFLVDLKEREEAFREKWGFEI
ncbi:MAG: GSCFA domain-containing protein [Saprospiraceae bacterium]